MFKFLAGVAVGVVISQPLLSISGKYLKPHYHYKLIEAVDQVAYNLNELSEKMRRNS